MFFVAECGIWKGSKQFLGKIDQLLSYLTWRDSKTALICFIRNKEFGTVIDTIKNTIHSHSCFENEEIISVVNGFDTDSSSRMIRLDQYVLLSYVFIILDDVASTSISVSLYRKLVKLRSRYRYPHIH